LPDRVIITTYNRSAYLKLTLEYLSRAEGIADKEIFIYADRGLSGQSLMDMCDVVREFPQLEIKTFIRPQHNYQGNSYNTLEAYKEAYYSEAKFVYLVEDDVLVQPDFFRWHEAVQAQGDYLCSVAYRCRRNPEARTDFMDPSAYIVSQADFASIGCGWRREKLAAIIEHAREEYYSDLSGYLEKHFPKNRFSSGYTEQDGLIMRIMAVTNAMVAWPCGYPRSFHFGVAGYNRPNGPRLSYEELKEMVYSPEKIKIADRDFGDIEVMPPPTPPWTTVYCAQRIN
jgi:hypothetical protein